ncbi:hypothetical protein LGMK_01925 [Leuconostoc sp. C2]|uniref:Uncharacterized protein n=1 Tax=Leuconostoc kimchii (strain IMSNU 11154 / KCTC 2386 / IH25) TaxID=762051 RepID=D5T095_LEUKI|nr:hypothetical protein LKI_00755 [Leuconostoc kimchii IMSNU 11154]AEJ30445.1 hypothetical protein LGMK_01925 [Leuconostoc sp. C2]
MENNDIKIALLPRFSLFIKILNSTMVTVALPKMKTSQFHLFY